MLSVSLNKTFPSLPSSFLYNGERTRGECYRATSWNCISSGKFKKKGFEVTPALWVKFDLVAVCLSEVRSVLVQC